MSEMTGIEIAEMARSYDAALASTILKQSEFHEAAKTALPRSLDVVTKYVTDGYIPIIYQTEEYAEAAIVEANRKADRTLSPQELATRVAVHMACGQLLGKDPNTVIMTEDVLGQRLSGVTESLSGMLKLRQASIEPRATLRVDVRVISSDSLRSAGRGKLARLVGGQLVVGAKRWYHIEPSTLDVATLDMAVFLGRAAEEAAYKAENSRVLMQERIARGDQG